jgi:hypothetical protein
MNEMSKDDVKRFLEQLADYLRTSEFAAKTRRQLEYLESTREAGKIVGAEGAVVDAILLGISQFLTVKEGAAEAREVLLAESTAAKKELKIASDSPASKDKHLFTKIIGEDPKKIIDLWWGDKGGLSQSCPDWALRNPYRIVFEGKVFREATEKAAKLTIVKGIYECFYYRALPLRVPVGKDKGWDYEYACLMIVDSSKSMLAAKAWGDLPKRIKDACWHSANIFVAVLPV